MAQMRLDEDLNECHEVFASEVVRALNKFYLISADLAPISDEVNYLTDGIYWGIITVSHLLREKNCKVFKSLRKGLKNENFFHECCMFIPTERNDRFFFNFLKRVSIIYEMAVFCYRNNDNYIETARNCIAQFQDKEYFKSAGSWERLNRIGSFLNIWSKRLRPVMIQEIHMGLPVLFTTTDEVAETRLDEEGKFEEFKSNDEDCSEDLTSDTSCPVERKRDFNSALVLLLAEEVTDIKELGSIEDEIKAIMRYLVTYLPHKITKYYKELTEDSKNKNDSRAESPNPQASSERLKTSNSKLKRANTKSETVNTKGDTKSQTVNTKGDTKSQTVNTKGDTKSPTVNTKGYTKSETVNTRNESTASSVYEQLAEEMASSLTEKISLKAEIEELGRVVEETKECVQGSSDSCRSKFTSRSDSNKGEKNKIGYSAILEEDLYLSESSNDENLERLGADKDCNENKIPSGGNLNHISDDATSESFSDYQYQAVPANFATNSHDDSDYIKFLEYDLFVKAETYRYTSFSHSNSDSDGTEPYSAINSLADEGDSGAAQNNIPSSENASLTMNIKSENKSEVKNSSLPLAIPTGSSTAASFADEEDSDSSSETNNEEQLTPTKSEKSSSSESEEEPKNISKANNVKPQQRKTKRRKKRGRSKK